MIFVFRILLLLPPAGYAEVTLDGTLGPQKALTGPDYQIRAEDGTIVNQTNLFHSFGNFTIDTNESATFTGPDTVSNIIGRVTGGAQSWIDGLIRTTIPDANLFLLNPSGFLFGPNASLDVQGSFHVSTADYLRLGEDGVFYANPNRNSILTVDSPSAFGFLGDNPAAICVQESNLQVPDGKTLSLVGGDIEVVGSETPNSGHVTAPGGRINIASVSSPGEVIPDSSGANPELQVDSFSELGSIQLYFGLVDAGGNGGGTILIRGGRFQVDSSYIYASNKGPLAEGGAPGTGIDIQVAGDILLDNPLGYGCVVGTNVYGQVPDDSGGVRISADSLEIIDGAQVQSAAFAGSSGNSGDIEINTNSLLLQNGGAISAGTAGSGKGGNILINTGSLEVRDDGYVYSSAYGGSGIGGDIIVNADSMVLSNEAYPGYFTGVTSQTYWPATGKAGDVLVHTGSLDMSAGTEISAATFNVGQGGNVQVTVEGDAHIEGTKEKDPSGGDIYTGIFGNTWWSGNGGNCEIHADDLSLTNEASIQVGALSTGNAGNATIDVNSLELTDGAFIQTSGYFGTGGDAGKVELTADSIFISGPESSPDPFNLDFTGISAASGALGGKGGEISVLADTLTITNRGTITAISSGPDPGGEITIDVGSLEVLNGANISASAFGSGPGGMIDVTADSILISGVHPEIFMDSITGKSNISRSAISSQAAQYGGSAGSIQINAESLQILDGGQLTTETYGAGNAGTIQVSADNVLISGVNEDLKNFVADSGGDPAYAGAGIAAGSSAALLGDQATGDCGDVRIAAAQLTMREGGQITSETSTTGTGGYIEVTADHINLYSGAFISAMSSGSSLTGKAGDISITAQDTFHSDNGSITTSAEHARGGDIAVSAQSMELLNNSLITAESSGEGDAGNIYLGAADSFLMRDSAVTTEAREADGGNIKVATGYMVHLVDSEITASVGGGPDTVGGNISIDPEYVILKNSRIVANAFEGRGGNIDIASKVFLADPDSVVDASSALGIDGEVNIRAPISSISGSIAPLPKDFRSVLALLREPCVARIQKGKYSSFVVEGRDSLPLEPGGVLPSPLPLQ